MNSNSKTIIPIQERLDALWKKISFQYKLAFFSTFILGWIANLYAFTNSLINQDTVNEGYQDLGLDFVLVQGRWLQYPCRLLGSIFPSPVIHGFFGIFALALSAAIITAIFQPLSRVSIVLMSLLLGSFPINACFFSYMYMSHIYYISLLFAVLAVLLVEQNRWYTCLLSAICVMCSVAIYQSFLSVTIALIVVVYFIKLLDLEHFQLKHWFLGGLRNAVTVVVGYVFYGIVTKILLAVRGVELRGYLGTDQSFSFSLSALPMTIQITLDDIKTFYLTTIWVQHKTFVLANLFMFGVFAGLALWAIIKCIRQRKFGLTALILVYLLVMPFLIDNIYLLMNLRGSVHMLMQYDYLVPYIMLVAVLPVLQRYAFSKKLPFDRICKHGSNLVSLGCLLAILIVSYHGFIITNQLYTRMENNMTAVNSSLTSMMTRIEEIEGWTPSQPVYIVNGRGLLNSTLSATQGYYQELGNTLWVGTDDYEWGTSSLMYSSQMYLYIYRYFNLLLELPTDEQCEAILTSDEYAGMDVFPAESSIRVIDGVVVVKMD
jgi:hypothetical protein